MPAEYTIDRERNVVILRLTGVLTSSELLEAQQLLGADPKFDPGMNEIVDGSGITDHRVDATTIGQLATVNLFSNGSKRALVGSSEIAFGKAQMFQSYAKRHGSTIRSFRKLSEALAWLGLQDAVE